MCLYALVVSIDIECLNFFSLQLIHEKLVLIFHIKTIITYMLMLLLFCYKDEQGQTFLCP